MISAMVVEKRVVVSSHNGLAEYDDEANLRLRIRVWNGVMGMVMTSVGRHDTNIGGSLGFA
jgi:hypothetical protein